MSPRLLFLPLDPLSQPRLDQLPAGVQQIRTGTEQGGANDRRPVARVMGRPDTWLLDGIEAAMAATEEACGLGSRRVLGPKP